MPQQTHRITAALIVLLFTVLMGCRASTAAFRSYTRDAAEVHAAARDAINQSEFDYFVSEVTPEGIVAEAKGIPGEVRGFWFFAKQWEEKAIVVFSIHEEGLCTDLHVEADAFTRRSPGNAWEFFPETNAVRVELKTLIDRIDETLGHNYCENSPSPFGEF